MIGVGEETGRLDEMLIKIAETYEENVRNTVKRFVSLLEPLIIVVMGAVVGFIVISMLLAIFSIEFLTPPEAKIRAVDRTERYLQNCRMRLKGYG
jgi:type II secretory pathway component PulF